jgi:hypothetical protein
VLATHLVLGVTTCGNELIDLFYANTCELPILSLTPTDELSNIPLSQLARLRPFNQTAWFYRSLRLAEPYFTLEITQCTEWS